MMYERSFIKFINHRSYTHLLYNVIHVTCTSVRVERKKLGEDSFKFHACSLFHLLEQ